MLECSVSEHFGLKWMNARGRIDGLTSPQIHRLLSELIQLGERSIVANLEGVNYVSSAGLRVFLQGQKELKKVEGEIVLYGLTPHVAKVFETSGFLAHFRSAAGLEEIESKFTALKDEAEVTSTQIGEIVLKCMRKQAGTGSFASMGSQEPLARSGYTESDVVEIGPGELRFGAGLAGLGSEYREYKELFGEALVIEHSLFVYPAVKRSAVDFMLFPGEQQGGGYKFFHGFGFSGPFEYLLSVESTEGFVQLSRMIDAVFETVEGDTLGIVMAAESKGLWGMNLKKVPIVDNKPPNGNDIFHPANFPDWMEFPVEPSDFNHIILAAGIAARDKASAGAPVRASLPEDGNFHLHAGVFSKGALSRNPASFESELKRVIGELEILKVQHMLGQSVFASATLGIVEIGR